MKIYCFKINNWLLCYIRVSKRQTNSIMVMVTIASNFEVFLKQKMCEDFFIVNLFFFYLHTTWGEIFWANSIVILNLFKLFCFEKHWRDNGPLFLLMSHSLIVIIKYMTRRHSDLLNLIIYIIIFYYTWYTNVDILYYFSFAIWISCEIIPVAIKLYRADARR